MLLPLDPAADRDDALGLRQVDRLLRFLERRLRLLPDRAGVDRRSPPCAIGAGGRAACRGVGAERADLEGHEVRRRAAGRDVGAQLALEHRPDVDVPIAVLLDRDDVGDERARRGGRPAPARSRASDRCAAGTPAPAAPARSAPPGPARSRRRCTRRSAGWSTTMTRSHVGRGQLGGRRIDARRRATAIRSGPPACCAAAIASHVARFSVPSRCSAITSTLIGAPSPRRAAWRSAASRPRPALPVISCVCLRLLGNVDRQDLLPAARPAAGAATLRISFFFAAMIPLSVRSAAG